MASNPQAFQRAAQKYGRLVDGVAAKYGRGLTGAQLLLKMAKGESGFDMGAVSSAGARGGTQFMPGTRAAFIRKYGVDPWKNPDQAIKGTALYLRNSGSVASYNPGMPSYTNYILGQKVGAVRSGGGAVRSGGGSPAPATPGTFRAGTAPTMIPGKTTQDISGAIVDALLAGQRGRQGQSLLGAAVSLLDTGNYNRTTKTRIAPGRSPSYTPGTSGTGTVGPGGAKPARVSGKVIVAPTANRAGVALQPGVINALRVIAGQAGRPITVGTGSNHNQFVAGTNRQSDHWLGNAADVPASGAALTKLGQQALIAMGMPRAQALKQQGGVYNLTWRGKRAQIIFNSNSGGNHYNHVHVGYR